MARVGTYKFLTMNGDGRPRAVEDHQCTDDLAALDKAYEMCAEHDVEVWSGALRVALVKRGETRN